ncbi:MAG: hypothetical protein Q9197_001966 [Variospora fuerteventurae]
MNSRDELSNEREGLGSWHPAHMPHSAQVTEINDQHNKQIQLDPPASGASIASSPTDTQSESPPPEHPEELLQISKPPRSEFFAHAGESAETTGDAEPSVESDQDGLVPGFDEKSKGVGPAINGISFLDTMTSDAILPQRSSTQPEGESYTSAVALVQDSGLQLGREPLKSLGKLDRTNSFPAVPPMHRALEGQQRVHSQSQAERSIEEDGETRDRAPRSSEARVFQQADPPDNPKRSYFGDLLDDGGDGFFDNTADIESSHRLFSPADEEARFEEGLPLVPSQSSGTHNQEAPAWPDPSSEPLSSPEVTADPDFSDEDLAYHEEASFFKPKTLDRKTTSQVLGSLSYPPHNATHDEPVMQSDRPSVPDISEDGAGALSGAAKSHPVGEGSQSMEDSPEGAITPKDEDLAAMWQAALDDDELLDDSEVSTNQAEPSAATAPTVDQQTAASPGLEPAYGADGSMLGSHSKSSAVARDRYSPVPANVNPTSFDAHHASTVGQQLLIPPAYDLSQSSSMPSGFRQTAVQQQPQSNTSALSRPSLPKPAQSFADKSKGGYTSPYDLPMDVSRPKKRTNLQQVQGVPNVRTSPQPPPPPRSSSMYAQSPPSEGPSPPIPLMPPLPGSGSSLSAARPSSSNVKQKPSVGGFFEELPIAKPRPPSRGGRYTPDVPPPMPNQLPSRPDPPRPMSIPQQSPSSSANVASVYQLAPPERQSPYADIAPQGITKAAPSQVNSRYSPALGLQSHVPPQRNRYAASPALGSRPQPSTQTMPFQPRTSSPLAQNHTMPQPQHRHSSLPSDLPARSHTPHKGAIIQEENPCDHSSALPQVEEQFEPSVGENVPEIFAEAGPGDSSPARKGLYSHFQGDNDDLRNFLSTSGTNAITAKFEATSTSSELRSQHSIHPRSTPRDLTEHSDVGPPRRSQTQSPGSTRPRPEALNRAKELDQRPVSASGRVSPVRADLPVPSSYAPSHRTTNNSMHDLNYIRPADGHEHDPLERWKGAPIFKFGFGGTTARSFPKHIPRYAAGHAFPMIKCNPGEVKLQTSNIGTLDDDIVKFPGPLKAKGRKKELTEWLQKKIDQFEKGQEFIVAASSLPDPVKKHEEKILLWKIMKVFVEYDGDIAGNTKAEQLVGAILCPEIAGSEGGRILSTTGGLSPGIMKHEGAYAVPNPVNPGAMEALRTFLLRGEREKGVWYAVDQRMWAHAMVLASTLDKSVWKQVLHEFTRLEVKARGENTESLAAIYEVFASNWDESIDQLVPPSARAGLQMVSKAAPTGPTRNALDGLDKWRETLALILSNRTPDDENALVALSRLLAGYGRIEAAHLCLIFTKPTSLFGGIEESQASAVLLGADHQQQMFDFGRDLDSILLTEVFEFVRSVLAPSASLSVSPHLQSYKLYHATLLAEHGYRSEAQQYCDAIMSTLKSTTKLSPYYHTLLFNALDDLMERLQQAPRDASSWMSKPMDKVSGSMWKKLNNFIVGDESDGASVTSGKGDQDAGPFARVPADTPGISRNASTTDLYAAFTSQSAPQPPSTMAFGSRYAPSNHYAPSGQYTPRSSLEQQGRPSEELQRPGQPSVLRPTQPQQPHSSHQPRYTVSPAHQPDASSQQPKTRYQPSPYISPKPDSYLPAPPSQPEHMPIAPADDSSASLHPQEMYQPHPPFNPQASKTRGTGTDILPNISYGPPSTYDPHVSAYEPPSSYTPYEPNGQDGQSPTDRKSPKKKKSFMDDDDDDDGDDFAARAASILKNERAQKDREADDAFRKAAEADGMSSSALVHYVAHMPNANSAHSAQKDQKDLKSKKSGWFGGVGGWLGGAKKEDNNLSSQEPKAIRAKLGEESSFYYDKELKKWVNKKGPAPAAAEPPKPPPPKGPPSRAVSAAGGPPPWSASRGATPPVPPLPGGLTEQKATPPSNVSQASPPTVGQQQGLLSGTGTPARAASPAFPPAMMATSSERASSEGPPSAPPSRPPTASNGPSSIEDLIGEPQARKGGTVRRGKKGRGYVDVMAK